MTGCWKSVISLWHVHNRPVSSCTLFTWRSLVHMEVPPTLVLISMRLLTKSEYGVFLAFFGIWVWYFSKGYQCISWWSPSDPAPAPAPIDVHTANRCSHSSHQTPRHPEMQITGPRWQDTFLRTSTVPWSCLSEIHQELSLWTLFTLFLM